MAKTPLLRLRRPKRDQVVPIPAYLDALLPTDHLARLIWLAVEQLDMEAFEVKIKTVEGGQGQAATDPRLLPAIWLYAATQGQTSARAVDRLCVEHLAYIWLCGGVSLNYHTLADFRVNYQAELETIFAQVLAALDQAGLIEYEQIAMDGLRVRAAAGAASFHRQSSLEASLQKARTVLAQLEQRAAPPADPASDLNAGRSAAKRRASRQQVERLEAALAALTQMASVAAEPEGEPSSSLEPPDGAEANRPEGAVAPETLARRRGRPRAKVSAKAKKKAKPPRTSTTDATAQVMKMADGGFRPAYNVQLAADSAQRVIVGVSVSTCGSDKQLALDMVRQVQARLERLPKQWAMDGGFVNLKAIEVIEGLGPVVLAPVPKPRDEKRERYAPVPTDHPKVAEWRTRMGTVEAKEAYRRRGATIELVNAQARCRSGLQQFPVRGLPKVTTVALWVALTHNLLIWLKSLVGQTGPEMLTPAG